MNGENIVANLSSEYQIKYVQGEKMVKFINALLQILPEESYFYNTSKEEFIQDNIENMMGIMRVERI